MPSANNRSDDGAQRRQNQQYMFGIFCFLLWVAILAYLSRKHWVCYELVLCLINCNTVIPPSSTSLATNDTRMCCCSNDCCWCCYSGDRTTCAGWRNDSNTKCTTSYRAENILSRANNKKQIIRAACRKIWLVS